jgi:hypothetical protein
MRCREGALVVALGWWRGACLDEDRDDHDCAAGEREGGAGALVECERHPEWAEEDLGSVIRPTCAAGIRTG